ncbi:transposase [Sulfurifustis variabilis]|uniref:Transposase n=1 Tax=Sulfurifustis variabilis TaxID=1675686 RepID=A0A1B4V7T6_9GAMM|nr:transposase [Sulfurifustis variabilis]
MAVLCRKLGVSRSGYYTWRARDASRRRLDDQRLLVVVRQIFAGSRETYGYPRIHAALRAQGIVCGRHRTARIMRENGLKARMARRFKYHRHRDYLFARTPNLLLELPPVSSPNEVWVGDVSYIRVRGKWSYIAIVMDHYTRKVLGWSFSMSHDAALTREALLMAVRTSPPSDRTIFHSDQGSEYAAKEYRAVLEAVGLRISMSRKGHCWDNAHMESFFGSLKTEMVYFQAFQHLEEAVAYITDYIRFYNCERLHSSLGYRSPTQFEANAA